MGVSRIEEDRHELDLMTGPGYSASAHRGRGHLFEHYSPPSAWHGILSSFDPGQSYGSSGCGLLRICPRLLRNLTARAGWMPSLMAFCGVLLVSGFGGAGRRPAGCERKQALLVLQCVLGRSGKLLLDQACRRAPGVSAAPGALSFVAVEWPGLVALAQ